MGLPEHHASWPPNSQSLPRSSKPSRYRPLHGVERYKNKYKTPSKEHKKYALFCYSQHTMAHVAASDQGLYCSSLLHRAVVVRGTGTRDRFPCVQHTTHTRTRAVITTVCPLRSPLPYLVNQQAIFLYVQDSSPSQLARKGSPSTDDLPMKLHIVNASNKLHN